VKRRVVLELFGNPAWLTDQARDIPANELLRMLTTYQLVQDNPRDLLQDPILPKFGGQAPGSIGIHIPEAVSMIFRREFPPAVAEALEVLDHTFIWDPSAGGVPRPTSELPASVYRDDMEPTWNRVDERTMGADEFRATSKGAGAGTARGTLSPFMRTAASPFLPRKERHCPLCDHEGGMLRELAVKEARRTRKRQLKAFMETFTKEILTEQRSQNELNLPSTEPSLEQLRRDVDSALAPVIEKTVRREMEAACRRAAVDFRDVDLLTRFVYETGRIQPRRRTQCCAKHQRWLARAIKLARNAFLISPIRRIGYDLVGRQTLR
jgi:ribosomal protein S18